MEDQVQNKQAAEEEAAEEIQDNQTEQTASGEENAAEAASQETVQADEKAVQAEAPKDNKKKAERASGQKGGKPRRPGLAMAIVLLVFGIISLAYGIYAVFSSISYVSSYYSTMGVSVSGNISQLIPYVISQCLSYLVLGVIALGGAQIILMLSKQARGEVLKPNYGTYSIVQDQAQQYVTENGCCKDDDAQAQKGESAQQPDAPESSETPAAPKTPEASEAPQDEKDSEK